MEQIKDDEGFLCCQLAETVVEAFGPCSDRTKIYINMEVEDTQVSDLILAEE